VFFEKKDKKEGTDSVFTKNTAGKIDKNIRND
jgi:hypothetical protein